MSSPLLAFLSAILLILAYPRPNLTWLAWVALVPLFHALVGIQRLSRAWWLGYAHGIVFFLGLLYWLTHVTILGYLLLVAYLACYPAAFAVGVAWFFRRREGALQHPLARLLFMPSCWALLEWVRNYALSGFSWGLLAYTQASHPPLIQIADLVGAYGVSWLIVAVNVAVGQCLRPQPLARKLQTALIALALLSCVVGYGARQLHAPAAGATLRITVVQGNIPQEEKWDRAYQESILQRYETLTRDAAAQQPDLIIWPETSVPGLWPIETWVTDHVRAVAGGTRTALLVGAPTTTTQLLDPAFWNSAVLLSAVGEPLAQYSKLHLVPFGEFIPFERQLPWLRRLIVTGDFDPGAEATVFRLPTQSSVPSPQSSASAAFSVLICFEDVFPELSRRFVRGGAQLLVNITNDAWFGRTSAAAQHLQASVFRAVECHVPVVRSANTGVSGFIDAHGRVTQLVADASRRTLFVTGLATSTVTLAAPDQRTYYVRWSDWWIVVCALIALSVIGYSRRRPFRS